MFSNTIELWRIVFSRPGRRNPNRAGKERPRCIDGDEPCISFSAPEGRAAIRRSANGYISLSASPNSPSGSPKNPRQTATSATHRGGLPPCCVAAARGNTPPAAATSRTCGRLCHRPDGHPTPSVDRTRVLATRALPAAGIAMALHHALHCTHAEAISVGCSAASMPIDDARYHTAGSKGVGREQR